jgi:hypothetical protein
MKYTLFIIALSFLVSYAQEKSPVTESPAPIPASTITATNPNAAEISFEKTTHDFGTLKKGSPVVYKFKYKNTGKEPLIIHNCRSGCGCTIPLCPKEPLKPGKTGYIEVHYDSMRVGHFTKEIMVFSNARNGVVTLIIKGVIQGDTEGTDGTPIKKEESPKTPVENKKE